MRKSQTKKDLHDRSLTYLEQYQPVLVCEMLELCDELE